MGDSDASVAVVRADVELMPTPAKIALILGASFLAGTGVAYLWKKQQQQRCSNTLGVGGSHQHVHQSTDASSSSSETKQQAAANESGTPKKTLIDATERFERISKLLGESLHEEDSWRSKVVIVVGLGGIGSHAAHTLVRSGVRKLKLIDFDQVTLSSLNRNALAVREDVGTPKVIAMKTRLLRINSSVEIEGLVEFFSMKVADKLLLNKDGSQPAFVLDCIDNIDTKVDLLRYCKEKEIRVISAMGAGCRVDPSEIRIGDISEITIDPLGRTTKRRLAKHHIKSGIPVVFSAETPKAKLLPLDTQQLEDPEAYQPLPNLRIRVLPVLGTTPAMFGDAMATHVVCELAGKSPTSASVLPANKSYYLKLMNQFAVYEKEYCNNEKPNVALRDLIHVVDRVWERKSSISNQTRDVMLARWHKERLPHVDNLVLLTKKELKAHYALDAIESHYPKEVVDRIEAKLRQSQHD